MANQDKITGEDVQGMASHWLGCPAGDYLGSDYGSDMRSVLQNPMGAGLADAQINKLRIDVPFLQATPSGSVDIFAYDDPQSPADRKRIALNVMGALIEASQ